VRGASDVAEVADEDEAVNAEVLVTADEVAVHGFRWRDADLDASEARGSAKVRHTTVHGLETRAWG